MKSETRLIIKQFIEENADSFTKNEFAKIIGMSLNQVLFIIKKNNIEITFSLTRSELKARKRLIAEKRREYELLLRENRQDRPPAVYGNMNILNYYSNLSI